MTVNISVNGHIIHTRSAKRIRPKGKPRKGQICTYKSDDGRMIKHRYGEGLPALAIKLVQEIVEI